MVQVLVWARDNGTAPGSYQRGDFVSLEEDGFHFGRKVVTSPVWNDPVDYSTKFGRALTAQERAAGEWPDFGIIDLTGITKAQFRAAFAARLAERLGLQQVPFRLRNVPKIARIDTSALPAMARNSLRDHGRVNATPAQLVQVLELKPGITLAQIRAKVTQNERDPGAWTQE